MLNLVFAIYATLAYKNILDQVGAFPQKYPCAPSVDELLKSNSGWEMAPGYKGDTVEKNFSSWGATIGYRYSEWRGSGFLREAIFDPIKITIPKCPAH
jgi:hypothetical protein